MLSTRKTFSQFINTQLRFYYAERFAALPKTESRVKQTANNDYCLALSTLPPNRSWFKTLFEKNWRNLLIIKDDILGYNAQKEQPAHPYEFRQYHADAILEHPVRLINLELLYAIPQDTWEMFISKLQHQAIVDKLGLRTHRHLWAAYSQYKESSLEARIQHAEWIGKYHFLISLHPLHRKDMCEDPVIRDQFKALTTQSYSRNTNPLAPLTALQPTCTPLFFKKVAHIPFVAEVLNLAAIVRDYANTFPTEAREITHFVDAARQQKAINWLPFSRTPKEAANIEMMLKYTEAFKARLNGSLFFTTKHKWQTETTVEAHQPSVNVRDIEDYLSITYHDLISREIHRELKKYHLTDAQQKRLYYKFKELFAKIIIDNATYKQLKALQSRWHHNHNVIEAAKPIQDNNPSWTALITPQTILGVTISALTSAQSLKEHGNHMHHCVSGYKHYCLNNLSDIFELKDKTGLCSTLEIGRYHQEFFVKQHCSKNNNDAPSHHAETAKLFIQGLNNKSIPVNPKRFLDQAPKAEIFNTSHYTDEEQEHLYAAYRDRELLPEKWMTPHHQALLKKLRLAELIQTTVERTLEPTIREREDEIDAENERERLPMGNCSVM